MIPEAYWVLLRRWFWLMLLFVALGTLGAIYLVPIGLGQTAASYNSSATLGVTRFVFPNGAVNRDSNGALADYTEAIAERVTRPQFVSRFNEAMAEEGFFDPTLELVEKVKVTADKRLARINLEASAESPGLAELLVKTATNILVEDVTAEERRIVDTLPDSVKQQIDEVLSRLGSLQSQRLELLGSLDQAAILKDLQTLAPFGGVINVESDAIEALMLDVAIITGNPELASLNAEVDALRNKLASLSTVQQDLVIGLLSSEGPVFVLNPAYTVPTDTLGGLRKRDMALLGGAAGLVLGWGAANGAEYLRNGRRNGRESEEERGEDPKP